MQYVFVRMIFSVCNAGYFHNGSDCVLCNGNEIKRVAGNATNCEVDTPCDGHTYAPKDEHTHCGVWTFAVFLTKFLQEHKTKCNNIHKDNFRK